MIKKPTETLSWTRFFKRFNFFGYFKHFVRIDITANSVQGNDESYLEWLGFVESKLFILLNLLAKETYVKEIRAFPNNLKNAELAELGLMDAEIGKFQHVDTYFLGF